MPDTPSEPSAARRALIEQAAAEIRARKEAAARHGDPSYADGKRDVRTMPATLPARGACPRCGKPYGERKRCYRCPGLRNASEAPRPAPTAPPSPTPNVAASCPGPPATPPPTVEVAPAWALVVRDVIDLGTVGLPDGPGLQGAYRSALELCLRLREAIPRPGAN